MKRGNSDVGSKSAWKVRSEKIDKAKFFTEHVNYVNKNGGGVSLTPPPPAGNRVRITLLLEFKRKILIIS